MLFEPDVVEVERLEVVVGVAVVVVVVVGSAVICVCVSVGVVVGAVAEVATATTLVPRKKSDTAVTSTAPLTLNQLPPSVTKSNPLTHFLGRFPSLYRPI
jgi:hypothetical protein